MSGSDRRGQGTASAAKVWLRALELTAPIPANPRRTLPVVIEALAASRGGAPALLSDSEQLSYRALAERANRYARWALAQGLGKGDVVCVLMPNRPDYMALWLGVTRAGGIAALLNTHLVGPSLAHCIRVAAPKHIVVAAELVEALRGALPHAPTEARIWVHDGVGGSSCPQFARIDEALEHCTGEPVREAERALPDIGDRALYIYTSGTTGLPKAAHVSHARLMQWSHWFAGLTGAGPDDRMYNCLPMYHSVGGVVATGAVLVAGGSVVIRERFTASRFWDEVMDWDCTLFQYIGELCRYLLNSPAAASETRHRLRLCCGNGLRADVWEAFQARFRIPRILEFYAATEGNISFYNVEGRPGAIGRIPPMLAHRFPAALVKLDLESGEALRDARGRCIPCGPDEPGEAIGRISTDPKLPGGAFEGYTNREATEKKVLRSVFEPGDAWFRTGDLMRRDAQGWFYFVDRVGETFRWKGENVSTTEVGQALCEFPGIREALVYGVEIPGYEGRAGMAAIVAAPDLDLAALREFLCGRLPGYARPVFLRSTRALAVTGTLKPVKTALLRDGYDPAATTDALYFDDDTLGRFVPLDAAAYARVRSGRLRP